MSAGAFPQYAPQSPPVPLQQPQLPPQYLYGGGVAAPQQFGGFPLVPRQAPEEISGFYQQVPWLDAWTPHACTR
jgi:hypothetical protein